MTDSSSAVSTLVIIPAYGLPALTDAVVGDLRRDGNDVDPTVRVVVVDNGGDYETPEGEISVYRPGRNLRWIGATNWALKTASREGYETCVVLNNDTRLSPGFLRGLIAPFATADDIAIAAACYDDFWLHQRASLIPPSAADYAPRDVVRDVDFCDGTAIAFAVAPVVELGGLDEAAFPGHGYGADIDLAIRVREAGLRSVVTEGAYVSHLRRQTMEQTGQSSEGNRAEILDGLTAKWGEGWRERVGLGPNSFPAHNTGSGASWYLTPPV